MANATPVIQFPPPMVIMVNYSSTVHLATVYSRITSAVCVTIIFLDYSSPVSLRESSTNCFDLSTCNFWTSEPNRDGIHRESLLHILLLSSVIDYITVYSPIKSMVQSCSTIVSMFPS